MMKKTLVQMIKKSFVITLITTISLTLSACKNIDLLGNTQLDGLSFEEITTSEKKFLIAKIDPQKYQFSIIENIFQDSALSIEEIHLQEKSLLSFNGNYFDHNFDPTGLLLSNNTTLFPLVKAELINGIFTINNKHQAKLFHFDDFKTQQENIIQNLEFAIQSGPILLNENGEISISNDNQKSAARTVIGLDSQNQIVVILLRQTLLQSQNTLTLYELAEILKNDPYFSELKLHSVLNLDGGKSSGISFDKKSYPEYEHVQNIIITHSR